MKFFRKIDKLTEVKTEIGMARAFVRLSLEKAFSRSFTAVVKRS